MATVQRLDTLIALQARALPESVRAAGQAELSALTAGHSPLPILDEGWRDDLFTFYAAEMQARAEAAEDEELERLKAQGSHKDLSKGL